MARRKDMLTQKKFPIAIEVYKALGSFFIALLESRWENENKIYDEFFSAINLNKKMQCEGTDRTWRRWKSKAKNNLFLGDRPELVFDAVEWARTYKFTKKTLIDDEEAWKLHDCFETLLYWDEICEDVNEEFQSRVYRIIDNAFELADFELIEATLEYKDKTTGEIFAYSSQCGFQITVKIKDKDKKRCKKKTFLRSCALNLINKAINLADQTLTDNEAVEMPLALFKNKEKLKSLSYANKKEVLRQLIFECENIADKAFTLGGELAVKDLLKAIKLKYVTI